MKILRPQNLSSIVGQTNVKARLKICLESCLSSGLAFPHTLFFGPPGTGKTTLAQALSNELNVNIQIANGSNINSISKLLPYLTRLEEGSILFIDEIHRLNIKVFEFLYVVIEDLRIDLDDGKNCSIDLPNFTFVGGTTNAGLIPKPLYDRFVLKCALDLYSIEELTQIVDINCKKLGLQLSDDAKTIVATSSRNTPRIVNNRLVWIKHYAQYHNIQIVNKADILNALKLEGINQHGIDDNDRKYLSMLKHHQPVGLNSLVSLTNIDKDTIENVIEPFLINLELIKKTTKGRMLC